MKARKKYCLSNAGPLAVALALLAPMSVVAAQPRVVVWGDNFYGQTNVPPGLTDVAAIAAGYNHCLAVRSNGTVVAWGDNFFGQTNVHVSLTNIVAVAGGEYHSLALRSNGLVYAWGLNNFGQLNWPGWLSNVTAIACGRSHSLALRSDGTVVAWGNNFSSQTNVPPHATNVVAISAGDAHCLVLRRDGTMVAWGDDASGQSTVPGDLTNIMAMAAGYHHNLAVLSNGTVAAWGVNVYGEATVPAGLSNVVAVAAGYFHSMALRNNGTVVAWGKEFAGQTNVPVGLNSVTAIAAGWDHDVALSFAPLCPPGFPDDFECRQTLAGSSTNFSISSSGATRELDEPLHAGVTCSNSLWFQWTAPAAGGVVILADGDFDFASPILAVYRGNSLGALTNVAFNTAPFSGSGSPLNRARVVFTAVPGETYQIAVDGKPTPSYESEGNLDLSLTLTPPPVNDAFQNATIIAGNYHETTNGTFAGASRESGEPSHGASDPQTLWWSWTAPTNLNVSTIPVRLTADAASFPPAIAVYTGGNVASLSPVTTVSQADGMTRTVTFSAIAGTNYRFALAGAQNDTNSVLPVVGNLRFRFNARALVLSISAVTAVATPTQALEFTATANIEHLGSAPTGLLRLSVTAIPGISMRGLFVSSINSPAVPQGIWPLGALGPGQTTNLSIAGLAPAPTEVENGISSADGYGVYAELQEQSAANDWITLDQALVLFGLWPDLEGLPGPGGGVIRLDPGYIGLSAFNPLVFVKVLGPTNVIEGNQAAYYGQAAYASGDQVTFTNTVWLASRFTITNGVFGPGIVTSNTVVVLTAKYAASGFTYDASTNVTVLNLPAPLLGQGRLAGGDFLVQVTGVTNRVHVLETATNLNNPVVWQPLATNNLGPTGLWNSTNSTGTIPRRFFRAREIE